MRASQPQRDRLSDVDDSLGLSCRRARYEISPYDRHPNAMAHEMIADFVAHSLHQEIR